MYISVQNFKYWTSKAKQFLCIRWNWWHLSFNLVCCKSFGEYSMRIAICEKYNICNWAKLLLIKWNFTLETYLWASSTQVLCIGLCKRSFTVLALYLIAFFMVVYWSHRTTHRHLAEFIRDFIETNALNGLSIATYRITLSTKRTWNCVRFVGELRILPANVLMFRF